MDIYDESGLPVGRVAPHPVECERQTEAMPEQIELPNGLFWRPYNTNGAGTIINRDGTAVMACDKGSAEKLAAAMQSASHAVDAESDGERIKPEALAALKNYKQADEDGVMALVSRQALHEAIAALIPILPQPSASAESVAFEWRACLKLLTASAWIGH